IVVRQDDGSVAVLVNRCAHRGTTVCAEERGSTQRFVCPYHGWIYDTAGRLRAVPVESDYQKDNRRRLSETSDCSSASVPVTRLMVPSIAATE
ncbi:MAG: Rieske 2Fe-2S domain-containing protein, partial [Burkholderiales bacterium]